MKNWVTWGLLAVLAGLTACSPRVSEVAPNTTPVISNPPQAAGTPTAEPISPGTLPPSPSIIMPSIHWGDIPDIIAEYGTKVEIKLLFNNNGVTPGTLTFRQPVKIIALPDVIPPSTVIKEFPSDSSEHILQGGESIPYPLEWDQRNSSGQQVSPGWYGVEVALPNSRGLATRVLVLPPGGVLEKTIEVNESKTVNNITFTLQRVELTATGIKVYAFNKPPGYKLPQGPMLPPPMFMLNTDAWYSFDGGPAKGTFPSGISFLDNGMLHTWGEYLDPAPKAAKELTFTVPQLGDWLGPWEYKIPLQ